MAITLDIFDDYLIFDNKETITLQNPGESPITINNVLRRPAVLATDFGGGNMVFGAAIEFIIWKNEAPALLSHDGIGAIMADDETPIAYSIPVDVPRINARITDQNGKHYRVDVVDDNAWRTRWNVKATSEASEGVN